MSLTGGHLDALLAAGATAEQIVALVKADMAEREEATRLRRSKDAARQRRHRESRDVTVTNADKRDTPPDGSPKDIYQTPSLAPRGKTEAKASSKNFVLPADIPAEQWAGFEDMRRRMKKPLSDRARSLAVTELRRLRDEEGWPPGEVLNHCVMNSYQGIFPPKRNHGNERRNTPSPLDQLVAASFRTGPRIG